MMTTDYVCGSGGVQLFLGFIILGPCAYMTLSNCQNWDGKKWRLIPDMLGVHVSVNIIIELIVIVEYTQWPELPFFIQKLCFPLFLLKGSSYDLFLNSHFSISRNKKRLVYVFTKLNEIISYFMVLVSTKVSYFFGQFFTKTATVQYTGNPSLFEGLKKMPLWDGFFSSLSFRSKHNGLTPIWRMICNTNYFSFFFTC